MRKKEIRALNDSGFFFFYAVYHIALVLCDSPWTNVEDTQLHWLSSRMCMSYRAMVCNTVVCLQPFVKNVQRRSILLLVRSFFSWLINVVNICTIQNVTRSAKRILKLTKNMEIRTIGQNNFKNDSKKLRVVWSFFYIPWSVRFTLSRFLICGEKKSWTRNTISHFESCLMIVFVVCSDFPANKIVLYVLNKRADMGVKKLANLCFLNRVSLPAIKHSVALQHRYDNKPTTQNYA